MAKKMWIKPYQLTLLIFLFTCVAHPYHVISSHPNGANEYSPLHDSSSILAIHNDEPQPLPVIPFIVISVVPYYLFVKRHQRLSLFQFFYFHLLLLKRMLLPIKYQAVFLDEQPLIL
ncbi:hypothetical protein JOD43_000794 [Pullulanibacillus pueri]|uniref:Uncharacterized protein n=1 Tax=Pullulanibacillus pueri TaxID=1437324 RepID=A0A8J3EMN3_9BACL|nr:hypothetical protein [Pullulanibacillus pueri]MBM7680632.1 hypothetical protein [Pullulanibacillus pueri]GGH83884.1 hypothetical protein GCM10007096_25680 [Pullulanibacillus pueri]